MVFGTILILGAVFGGTTNSPCSTTFSRRYRFRAAHYQPASLRPFLRTAFLGLSTTLSRSRLVRRFGFSSWILSPNYTFPTFTATPHTTTTPFIQAHASTTLHPPSPLSPHHTPLPLPTPHPTPHPPPPLPPPPLLHTHTAPALTCCTHTPRLHVTTAHTHTPPLHLHSFLHCTHLLSVGI